VLLLGWASDCQASHALDFSIRLLGSLIFDCVRELSEPVIILGGSVVELTSFC
jgi:hypothetical protein